MIDAFNSSISLILGITLTWVILNPKIKEGIIMKAGLIFLALGFFGAFFVYQDAPVNHDAAIDAVHAVMYMGAVICLVGYLIRIRRTKRPARRTTDWMELE